MKWQPWVVACGVGGILAGAAWPPPPIPRAKKDEASWSVPAQERVKRYSSEAYQQARQGVRWAGDASGGSNPQAAWRLAGLVYAPVPTALIMRLDNSTIERIRTGGALPDGSSLIKIEGNTIQVQQDNCQLTYQLHYQQPISASTGCPTPTAPVSDAEKRESST
ncbi:hypothetical protein [Aerolutibacter ruishenii]|uniref:Uncharacterized protein n=1 Tax=Aerolutibacter ruishenii TaxID=686800 RepID=A0A562M3B8_9GAMM|nr:hypothetical protein [Lysobacter ruishenii]TWI14278.1 hypothetical protein IP93_00273 [Lysobacter ruishenii]